MISDDPTSELRERTTMNRVKLTVGIPTFNRAEWLRQSIESVLAQSFASFRLIVSDNASDDNTPEVVRSFGDERIDYQRSERNLGRIGNLNRLITLADSEFLLLLPDDDLLYPDHLRAAVEALERFGTAGLAHSAFYVIDGGSQVVRRIDPAPSRSPVTIERGNLAIERMMVSGWPICFSSVVYRTRAIVEAGGFREEREPFGDLQTWMRIALAWDFAYIAKPLVGFRVHEESATTSIGSRQEGSDGREFDRVCTPIRLQRRTEFLDDTPLEPRDNHWLGALATLGFVIDRAQTGLLPWGHVVGDVAKLVWSAPRILLRPEPWVIVLRPQVWRHLLGRLGARRARHALRRAFPGHF